MPLTTRLLTAGAAGLALIGAIAAPAAVAAAPLSIEAPAAVPLSTEASAAVPLSTEASAAGQLSAEVAVPVGAFSTGALAAASAAGATTGATERRRVDSVATPGLRWYTCYGWAQCATAEVPLDYDRPHGRKVTIALLRVRARDQKNRIGSLFVNPGGPGGSATAMALAAPYFLSDTLLNRFDVVGMDPRGIGFSDQVTCFRDPAAQQTALKALSLGFPYGAKEEKTFVKAAVTAGRACSTTGRELAGAMSTAEVARDMEVMRRAVGDRKLSYLGFSYGTALGQYYATMFPDRFRAVAVDGVISPKAWVGGVSTAGQIQDDRLRSADGAWKALLEILRRCDRAGAAKCAFSDRPLHQFREIADRLQRRPLVVGEQKVTYAGFVGLVLGALYDAEAGAEVTDLAAQVYRLTTPGFVPSRVQIADLAATVGRMRREAEGRAFPYDNSFDAYSAVMCTDGRHPARAATWAKAAARADRRAPYFGRAWAWASVQCARESWTVRDEDAWTGPFNRRTRNPVLFVGSYWDPATNYADAVKSARLMPNSRLLSSANWGHTAYGTSRCVTGAMDRYLLATTLPAPGATCVGDVQPFRTKLADETGKADSDGVFDLNTATVAEIAAQGLPAPDAPKVLPPVR